MFFNILRVSVLIVLIMFLHIIFISIKPTSEYHFSRVLIGLMHDDVLLISFTTKPHIQNANVFQEDRN